MGNREQASRLLSRLSSEFQRDYKPQRVLGEGAMGVVILAEQVQLARQVAIKFLSCFADPESVRRFQREAHLASKLDHPSIVKLYTSGVDSDMPYLVYEFVPGDTLRGRIAQVTRLDPDVAAVLMRQLFEGLAHAHGEQILHRDLKPANVLVTVEDDLKIADYGIGSNLEVQWALTRTGMLLGTPAYMSPEQWIAESTLATDVYAAGLIYQEMLTGENPFYRPSLTKTRDAHRDEPRPSLPPGMDPRLDELLDALMAKAPGARPTAAQALERLEEIERTKPGTSARSGVAAASSPRSGNSWTSSRRRAAMGGLALTVGGALALAGLALRPRAALTAPAVIVAGMRSAAVLLELDGRAQVTVAVQPPAPDLTVTVADRDGAGRRVALSLRGLEPGTRYRVQPLLEGRPVGPTAPLTTLSSMDQIARVVSISFTDPDSVRVRFSSPLGVPAGLSLAGEMPSAWVAGSAGEERVLTASGLDPDGSAKPMIAFEGLPERVLLADLPGARRVVERARARLASRTGGPGFKDQVAVAGRLAQIATGLVVKPERVREELDRFVATATGFKVELVLSAAAARAGDLTAPVTERWHAAEVLDGLLVLDVIGRAWCGQAVLDVEGRRPRFPYTQSEDGLPRPRGAPQFEEWFPRGPARTHVERSAFSMWTHRDQQQAVELMRMNPGVSAALEVEERLMKSPFWASLSPAAPLPAGGDLVVRMCQLVEGRILWLRFGGEHQLAIPGPPGTRPMGDAGVQARRANARAVRIALPVGLPTAGGLEVRLDSFEASRSQPFPQESWMVDLWVTPGPPDRARGR